MCDLNLDLVDDRVGIVMPEMSTLRVSDFVGSNGHELKVILDLLGIPEASSKRMHFAAGSMYLMRTSCFVDFRSKIPKIVGLLGEEGYRIDGSYAHAMERCMQLFAYRSGLFMRSTAELVRHS